MGRDGRQGGGGGDGIEGLSWRSHVRVMNAGVDVACMVNEEIWDVRRFREGVYQGRV